MCAAMRLINRCKRLSYDDFSHNRLAIQDQVRLIAILACLLAHLALFQFVDASTPTLSSSSPLGNGNGNGNGNYIASQKKERPSRGQAVIESVPKEDRGMFIVFHLAKALKINTNANETISNEVLPIPQKKSLTFKDIRTYDTFSADLLKWTMRTFGWSQLDVSTLVRRCKKLCTSKGWCFNPTDIGTLCCPF